MFYLVFAVGVNRQYRSKRRHSSILDSNAAEAKTLFQTFSPSKIRSAASFDFFLVPNAAKDEPFRDNRLVTGAPHIRFYADTPLITEDGHAPGTLCVIDRRPRRLSAKQKEARLARQAVVQLSMRRQTAALVRTNELLKQSEEILRSPIIEYAGKSAVLSVNRNLTLRKRMKTALSEREARSRSIVEAPGEWIWQEDAEDFLTYSNSAVEKILDYAPEEPGGKSFLPSARQLSENRPLVTCWR